MDNLMLDKIKELISQSENIGIIVGKNPGIDEMAGALALYLALTQAGRKATVACPTDPIVEISSLVGIDKVKKSLDIDGKGDLTVSFPDKGDIEKISYTREDGSLNIIVKAGENGLSFDEKEVIFKKSGGAPGLVFVIGTPRLSDLGSLFDPELLKDSKVINIDHKAENQGFGDIPLIGRNSSSTSELVANLMSSLGLKMDIDIASNLMSGIISATDNFQSPSTSALAFETAALLMKKGAVREAKTLRKQNANAVEEDSFFSPKAQPKPTFAKTSTFANASADKTIGTEEKKPSFAKEGPSPLRQSSSEASEPTEDNPPDDWLAPKIYKGSTSI